MLRPDKGITETVQSKRNCHITVAVPFYMQVIWTGNACYYYPQRSLHRHENRHPPHADPAAAVPGMGDHLRGAIQHPRKADRSVAYANKQELELAIMCRHVRMPAASGAAPASNKADARRGQQADPSAGHHGQEPPDGQKSLRP